MRLLRQGFRYEAHVPTQPPAASADARFSRPDEHQERPAGVEAPPRQGSETPDRVVVGAVSAASGNGLPGPRGQRFPADARIRQRAVFRRVYDHGVKLHGRYLTLFVLQNDLDCSRLGIAATRKIGGAVVRNRIKRRLREIFRTRRPRTAVDLVIVPKRESVAASFEGLVHDFDNGLARYRRTRPSPARRHDQA